MTDESEKDKLGMALSKVCFQYEPALLKADLEATARTAAAMSKVLGCLLATFLKEGPDVYDAALTAVLLNIHDFAKGTKRKSDDMTPNTTPH